MPNPLLAFFAQFPALAYTQSEHPSAAFARLVDLPHLWEPRYGADNERRLNWAYRDALVKEFNGLFGTAVDDLPVWQHLCRRIGIEAPPTVPECRQVRVGCLSLTDTHC